MQFNSFSIVAGSLACQARCQFCIARMTPANSVGKRLPPVNWRNFHKACRLAQLGGTTTVLITSKGEPTLFPDQITEYLQNMERYNFPIIEMQTNGIAIAEGTVTEEHLRQWYDLGLTTLAISIVHYDPVKNHEVYLPYRKRVAPASPMSDASSGTVSTQQGEDLTAPTAGETEVARRAAGKLIDLPLSDEQSLGKALSTRASEGKAEGYIDLVDLFKLLKERSRRFSIRLTCIGADGFIDSADELHKLLTFAKYHDVEQVTLTPVTKPFDSSDLEAFAWVSKHHLKDKQLENIKDYLAKHGQVVRTLGHGAVIYDINGQNLNLSNCLTRDQQVSQSRSLIFFPDGHVRTNWDMSGSVLF